MTISWWLTGKHKLYWGWWECWIPLIEGRHIMHTDALLDSDCWIDRNPYPGDCGRLQGPGHVLPRASVEEEKGLKKAKRMGVHTSQQTRQPWEHKQAQRLVVFDLICSALLKRTRLVHAAQKQAVLHRTALNFHQFLLLMETSPKALNICWGLCTKKRWQYLLLLIFL